MDDPVVVCKGEPAGHLVDERKSPVDRQLSLSLDELLEVLALDVLEADELPPLELSAVADRDDVGMVQLGERTGLTPEALDVLGVVREMLVQDLDRHSALEHRVARPVDARHPSRADDLLQ